MNIGSFIRNKKYKIDKKQKNVAYKAKIKMYKSIRNKLTEEEMLYIDNYSGTISGDDFASHKGEG